MSQEPERAVQVRHAIDLLIRTSRLHHRNIEKLFGDTGLHRSQRMLLLLLSHFEGVISQREIADRFDISPACVARALKSLSSEGYIQRSDNAADLRRNNVSITEKGLHIVNETKRTFDQFDQRVFEGFSEEEIAELILLLERVQQNLRRDRNG